MVLHPIVRPLGLIIAFLGLVQGLFWFILCLLGILIKYEIIVPANGTSYSTILSETICLLYLGKHNKLDKRYINNQNFHIFLYVYLVLSIVWFFNSSYIFWLLRLDKWKPIRKSFVMWIIVVTMTSILDLCLTVMIGVDYRDIVKSMASMPILAVGIVMSIVARGYLLWFLNILAIICVGNFIANLDIQENQSENYPPPISAYGTGNPPISYSPSFVEVANNANPTPQVYHVNGAFVEEEVPWEGGVFPSYSHRGQEYQGFDEFPAMRQQEPHVAKIGRGNHRKSPVLNKVPPPVVPKFDPNMPPIPTPDYTPPGSPKPRKSVLKANHQYAVY